MKYFNVKIKKAPSQYGCPSTACGRNTRTPLVLCSFLFHFMIWFTEYTFILEQKKDSKTEWIALKHYKHYKHYFSIWFLEKSHMRFNDKSFCEYAPNIIQNLWTCSNMILNLSFMHTHISTTDMTLRETQYPHLGTPVIDCSAVTS